MACSIITTIMFIHLCCLTLLSSHLVICRGSSEIPCIPSEREALVEFKQYLEDPSNRLSSWNADVNTNCCEWAGVVCSNVTSHILQLHLNISQPLDGFLTQEAYDNYRRTKFGGKINPSLLDLKYLNYLDLSGHAFGGMQIPDFLCAMTPLTYLNLSVAGFSGKIPHQIGNLSNLLYLDLGYAANGTIPYQIGNLSNLLYLDLGGHDSEPLFAKNVDWLSGLSSLKYLALSNANLSKSSDWLQTMQALPSLVELHLSKCILPHYYYQPSTTNFSSLLTLQLSRIFSLSPTISSVPSWIFGLRKLISLQMSYNDIQGPIPNGIRNLSLLENLDLSFNSFSSSIPDWLYGLHHLKFLNLEWNNLHGTISDVLGNLTSLVDLDLSYNKLEGMIPTTLGNLPSLADLGLSSNKLEGMIPTTLGNHIKGELQSTLQNPIFYGWIDLSSNQLSGQLPHLSAEVVNLDLSSNLFSGSMFDFLCKKNDEPKILEFLNLSSNNLSGEIPDCWQMWPSMVYVNLESNYFVGNLPPSLGSLAWLQYLHIRNNTLSGIFPPILKKASKLVTLDLGENKLTGIIPAWVGEKLLNLERLRLRSNNFSGRIPSQICALSVLRVLDLAQNNLFANIPNCFNHLNAMMLKNKSNDSWVMLESANQSIIPEYDSMLLWLKGRGDEYRSFLGIVTNIDLSNNNLSGKIPREITDLDGLIFLNLSKNQLTDQIPPGIGNMQSLESIDFSRNQLSGEIPPTISNISFLHQLDLSSNHLKGEIPTGTQIQSLEASNFVGNNLCGPPLPINCNSHFKIPNNADQNDEESDGHGVNWFFVSVALGFIVGFWGVVAPLFISRSWRYTYYRFIDDMWYKIQSCW